MRIRYMSDLHLEFGHNNPADLPSIGEDVVVLAGDISTGLKGITWAQDAIRDRPVIYVMGNHEYYHEHYHSLIDRARMLAQGSNVHLLENDAITLEGVRFLGCSLWTDFLGMGPGTQGIAMEEAYALNDYRLIQVGHEGLRRRITPADTLNWHTQSRRWLEREIDSASEPCVVVTHHGPSMQACEARYRGGLLTTSFLSDLDSMVRAPVQAWIFGHTHYSCELEVAGIPLLSNQRGYPREGVAFNWNQTIEIDSTRASP